MIVRNLTTGAELGDRIAVADDSRTRRTGLLRHSGLNPGEGLWIVPCEAVHMFGMKFPIDVVFVSRDRGVLKTRERMPPTSLPWVGLALAGAALLILRGWWAAAALAALVALLWNPMRRGAAMCLRAHSVLELPAGTISSTGTRAGDQLEFQR